MKTFLISTLAVAALMAAPDSASAKVRGCAYRLAGLDDARFELRRARLEGGNVELARAQLRRAESKAREERCFFERRRFDGKRVDRRDLDRRRFDRGRDLNRRGWVFEGSKRGFRDFDRGKKKANFDRIRNRARKRFVTLVEIRSKRRLSDLERRELWRLRYKWGF